MCRADVDTRHFIDESIISPKGMPIQPDANLLAWHRMQAERPLRGVEVQEVSKEEWLAEMDTFRAKLRESREQGK